MTSSNGHGSLDGIRVIDLTRVLGGPYCTQVLGDHGAEVIKIEPPQGDEVRDWGPPFRDGTASYFVGVNRNKRTLALDLTKAEARDVLLRLLEGADVLIHNYKPGTLERWSIGYQQTLAKRFPRLIYCHITGFGEDGPLGGLPGYDAAVQAVSGLMSINGTEDSGPVRIGTPIVDIGTGLNAAIGILMALNDRHRTGKGQGIDVSLYDSAVSFLHPHAANYLMSGKPPKRIGNAHPNISPYDSYKTSTKPIFLAVGNDRQFERLCGELGAPELAKDKRFLRNADRNAHREELKAELERLLANHDSAQLAERLLRIGVPCGAVLDLPDVLAAPHTEHRRMVEKNGVYSGTGIPIKMSRTKGAVRMTPRTFNQDGADILREAGYSTPQIEALTQAGAFVTERRKGGGE
jgi:crotonobetainyl-CoA:carnitine CoA-transferase CaiB-like acyl-CoA transferase